MNVKVEFSESLKNLIFSEWYGVLLFLLFLFGLWLLVSGMMSRLLFVGDKPIPKFRRHVFWKSGLLISLFAGCVLSILAFKNSKKISDTSNFWIGNWHIPNCIITKNEDDWILVFEKTDGKLKGVFYDGNEKAQGYFSYILPSKFGENKIQGKASFEFSKDRYDFSAWSVSNNSWKCELEPKKENKNKNTIKFAAWRD